MRVDLRNSASGREPRTAFARTGAMRVLVPIVPVFLAAAFACASSPPALEDPRSLSPAELQVQTGRLVVSAPASDAPALVPVEARSFRDWSELVAFAEKELGGEPVYGPDGEMVAIQGELIQQGPVVFRDADGSVFADDELVAAYLGGATGRLTVAGEVFDLQRVAPESSVVLLAKSEDCQGSDCVAGESWVTHRFIYHSVGGKTRQASGGTRALSYPCCNSGRLVTVDGRRQCRFLNPGAWEYDRELGRLVPKLDDPSEDLYRFTDPQTCSRQVLANHLRLDLRLIFGPNQATTLSREGDNVREIQIKRWLVSVGGDIAGTQFVDDVVGVCGFHSSTRGGPTETHDGFTGDDNVLCRRN